jgi:hypothetical protein
VGLPPEIVAELEAARALLRRSGGPGAVILRLSRDRAGVERLVAITFEGVKLSQVVDGDERIARK